MARRLNLLAIVGPTASGKTGLSIEIAKKYNGEIIAADSRTVYKGLDIGTAKPTLAERQGVPHWGLDIVGPEETFTAADFQKYAKQKVNEIKKRGKLPIIVGGTGLYVDAVLYNFSFAPTDEKLRDELMGLGIVDLQRLIQQRGLSMPENSQNRRYLIRTLERGNTLPKRNELQEGTVLIGLHPSRQTLEQRINDRANLMLEQGVIEEVSWAFAHYGVDSEALTGGIYRIFRDVIRGELPKDEARKLFVTSDLQLAKRQITWFKRNHDICWFEDAEKALTWFNRTFGGTLK